MVSGLLSTGVANTDVICADNEFLHFSPPSGKTCIDYMSSYIKVFGGRLQDNNATSECSYCPISETNKFLEGVSSNYDDRWRNFGILWAFVIFNIFAALFVYWLARMPKKNLGNEKKKKKE